MEKALKQRIIEHARDRFLSSGFSKVTMDELSLELGISKKTMYQHFGSKDDLMDAVMEWQIIDTGGRIAEVMKSSEDFLTKLYNFWTVIGQATCRISKRFQDDIRKYRPDLWKRVEEVRRKNIQLYFTKMIQDGVKRGLVRDDVNLEIIILMFLSSIQGVVNPEVLVQHSFSTEEALKTITRVYLDGILTEHARQEFRTRISQ